MIDKSPKSGPSVLCHCCFPGHCAPLVQSHMVPLLCTAPPHSTWLFSLVPFSWAGIRLTSAAPSPMDTSHTRTTFQHHSLEWEGGMGRVQAATEDNVCRADPNNLPDGESEAKCHTSSDTFIISPPLNHVLSDYVAPWPRHMVLSHAPSLHSKQVGIYAGIHAKIKIFKLISVCRHISFFVRVHGGGVVEKAAHPSAVTNNEIQLPRY